MQSYNVSAIEKVRAPRIRRMRAIDLCLLNSRPRVIGLSSCNRAGETTNLHTTVAASNRELQVCEENRYMHRYRDMTTVAARLKWI